MYTISISFMLTVLYKRKGIDIRRFHLFYCLILYNSESKGQAAAAL